MGEDFADITLTNLKVLGMAQKGSKLAVRKGHLCLDEPGYARFVRRWLHNDCRDLTLMHVRSTVNSALAMVASAAVDHVVRRPIEDNGENQEARLADERRRLLREFRNAAKGLENLRCTYRQDSMMVASLDVLLEKLLRACGSLEAPPERVRPLAAAHVSGKVTP